MFMSKAEKPKEPRFVVKITFGNEIFKGEGLTLLEALQKVKSPVNIFIKGTLDVTDGTKTLSKTLLPFKMRRLFQPLAQRVIAKQLMLLMK